jgi:hypothetical protein
MGRDDDRSRSRDKKEKKDKKKEDSAERSRERERRRRRAQQQYLQKHGKKSANEGAMFWDGFQWMPKVAGVHGADAQLQAQSRRARRLYLGNLPFQGGITEDMLTVEINKAMKERNLCENVEGDPVIHMWFARDKQGQYGFVEFRSQSECERALLLDGLMCCGAAVQIRRPSDFPMSPMPDILPLPGMPSPPPGMPAIGGMDYGMGGKGGPMGALPGMPQMALAAPMPIVESNIVRIKQVFTVDNETDDSDFTEVLEDMKQGCSAHGQVIKIDIVRPKHLQRIPGCTIADVFILFGDNVMAGTCIGKMTGRKYDGKQIGIESYPRDKYEQIVKPAFAAP